MFIYFQRVWFMLMKGGWFDLNSFNIRRDHSILSIQCLKDIIWFNTRISAELMHYYGIEFVCSLSNIQCFTPHKQANPTFKVDFLIGICFEEWCEFLPILICFSVSWQEVNYTAYTVHRLGRWKLVPRSQGDTWTNECCTTVSAAIRKWSHCFSVQVKSAL